MIKNGTRKNNGVNNLHSCVLHLCVQVYERLDDIGADTAEARASHLLRNNIIYTNQIILYYYQIKWANIWRYLLLVWKEQYIYEKIKFLKTFSGKIRNDLQRVLFFFLAFWNNILVRVAICTQILPNISKLSEFNSLGRENYEFFLYLFWPFFFTVCVMWQSCHDCHIKQTVKIKTKIVQNK